MWDLPKAIAVLVTQMDDAKVTCWRTYKFCICCLSGQRFSSSKHFQLFLQVYLIPQGWTVLFVQCVIHTQNLSLHMHTPKGRKLQPSPVAIQASNKKKKYQHSKSSVQLPMTSLQYTRSGHCCYCTLEMPESQIICALDNKGKGRVCLSWTHPCRIAAATCSSKCNL